MTLRGCLAVLFALSLLPLGAGCNKSSERTSNAPDGFSNAGQAPGGGSGQAAANASAAPRVARAGAEGCSVTAHQAGHVISHQHSGLGFVVINLPVKVECGEMLQVSQDPGVVWRLFEFMPNGGEGLKANEEVIFDAMWVELQRDTEARGWTNDGYKVVLTPGGNRVQRYRSIIPPQGEQAQTAVYTFVRYAAAPNGSIWVLSLSVADLTVPADPEVGFEDLESVLPYLDSLAANPGG